MNNKIAPLGQDKLISAAPVGTLNLRAIAQALGGTISGSEVLCATPGHSPRDRGTSVRIAPGAPDGLLVHCHNGGWSEVTQIKDKLRDAGLLPAFGGRRHELTATEKAAIKRAEAERLAEREAEHRRVEGLAKLMLDKSWPADFDHPYLVKKGISSEGLFQTYDRLLVPMTDRSGALKNLQLIEPTGAKRFLRGGQTQGLIWWAGVPSDRLIIGEGMATVAAVRRATGLPVVAAMSASNLPIVANLIRASRPNLTLIIAADDDAAGLKAAELAAAKTGASIALAGEIFA